MISVTHSFRLNFITTLSILSNPLNYRKELKKQKSPKLKQKKQTMVYINSEGKLTMNKFDIKHKKNVKASLVPKETF